MGSAPRTRPSSLSPSIKNKSSRPCKSSIPIPLQPSLNLFPSSISDLFRLIAVVVVAATVAFSCNYVFTSLNQQPIPFCDSNTHFHDSLSDFCEPCPLNGVCHEGKLECAHGYRRLGNLCVEDSNINEAAKKLSQLVEALLCEEYAQYSCTGTGTGTGTVWVQSNQLWEKMNESKLMDEYGLNEAVYAHAMKRAMEALHRDLETRLNDHGIEELKCPASLVLHYTPVSCRIQQWILEHALLVVPACALLLGCTFLLLKLRQRYYLSVRAEQIYNEACDVLEEKALGARSGTHEPWVVASLLRDHLLSPKERKDPRLWKKVEQLIQEDSRLERYPKMVKGECKVVWEWQVEGSLSSSGKRKKAKESKLASGQHAEVSRQQRNWPWKAKEPVNC